MHPRTRAVRERDQPPLQRGKTGSSKRVFSSCSFIGQMENCLSFWSSAQDCLPYGWPIAAGSAFPICSVYHMLVNFFLTFDFKKKCLIAAECGKWKSRFARGER